MTKPVYLLLTGMVVFAFSCVTFKQFDDKARSARESGYQAAIIKEDGTVISGSELKHRNYDPYDHNLVRVTNSPKAFTLDGKVYADNDVVCFQDGKAFHKRFRNAYLIRLVKGKINLYYFDNTYNQAYAMQGNRTTAYFYEKTPGEIGGVSPASLREAVKDNPGALAKMNAVYPKDKVMGELNVEKLVAVVNVYNQ